MNPTPNDELLSAYLDDELSADERARVERLLAEQPESRALLEDLRALRSGLESLPRHRLEGNFAERVLRRAEREMLAPELEAGRPDRLRELPGTSSASAAAVSRSASDAMADEDGSVSPPEANWPWRAGRRTWAWAGLAAAAALLVMLFTPDRVADREAEHLARAPDPAALPAAGDLRAPRDGEREDSIELRMDKPAGPRGPMSKAAPPAAGNGSIEAPFANDQQDFDQRDFSGKEGRAENESKSGQSDRPMRSKSPEAGASRAPTQQPEAAPTPQAPAAAGGAGARSAARDSMPDDQPVQRARRTARPQPSRAAGQAGQSARELGRQSDLDADLEAGTPTYRFDAADEDVLVVVCDVPDSATYRKTFESLLAGQNIDLDSPVELKEERQRPADDQADAARPSTENMATLQRRLAAGALDRVAKQSLGSAQIDQDAFAGRLGDQAVQEIVYVEATAEQLEATLENMAESETFLKIAVDPAPAVPAQENWYFYSRSRKLAELADETLEAGQRQGREQKAAKLRAGGLSKDFKKEKAPAERDVAAEAPRGKAQRYELAPIDSADEKSDALGGLSPGLSPKLGQQVQRRQAAGKDAGKAAPGRGAGERRDAQTDLYRAVFVFRALPEAASEPAAESAPPAAKK
ncbi:MAG: zf-HC2 domain-containing protein [Pirellulales bacterium]